MQQPTPQALSAMPPAFRTPKRLTITLPYGVYQALKLVPALSLQPLNLITHNLRERIQRQ